MFIVVGFYYDSSGAPIVYLARSGRQLAEVLLGLHVNTMQIRVFQIPDNGELLEIEPRSIEL